MSMVPRERVKRARRASWLDRGPGASRRLPPQLSVEIHWSVRPLEGRATESGLIWEGRTGGVDPRARRPAVVSRTNAAGRGVWRHGADNAGPDLPDFPRTRRNPPRPPYRHLQPALCG